MKDNSRNYSRNYSHHYFSFPPALPSGAVPQLLTPLSMQLLTQLFTQLFMQPFTPLLLPYSINNSQSFPIVWIAMSTQAMTNSKLICLFVWQWIIRMPGVWLYHKKARLSVCEGPQLHDCFYKCLRPCKYMQSQDERTKARFCGYAGYGRPAMTRNKSLHIVKNALVTIRSQNLCAFFYVTQNSRELSADLPA